MEDPHGEGRGWAVDLLHPWDPKNRLGRVWLLNRAMGTSAATFRHLVHQGKKLSHVLDPRTGWPASGLASVSVLAPTAAEADALSTAFFVGGVDLAKRYCAAHPEIGAILLSEGTGRLQVLGLSPKDYE
jgi:thiamine biosynthesis lipoprotein